jgi:hypothetical protein
VEGNLDSKHEREGTRNPSVGVILDEFISSAMNAAISTNLRKIRKITNRTNSKTAKT